VEHGRNGYVVKSGSYRQLEMALKKIISDSTLANRMSSASLAKIREITPREGAKAFIKAIGYVSAGLR
jgi:glycosyltransferase involved in cell wall biosynthesis